MLDAARKGADIVGIERGPLDDFFGGPGNDQRIRGAVKICLENDGIFLGAWGKHAKPDRVREVVAILEPLVIHCIKQNIDGSPIHPLYQKDSSMPVVWERP